MLSSVFSKVYDGHSTGKNMRRNQNNNLYSIFENENYHKLKPKCKHFNNFIVRI